MTRNSMRRADRTRTCNLRFWRPLRYQLRHYPMDRKPVRLRVFHSLPSGARHHRVFNTGEPVYATTASTSNRLPPDPGGLRKSADPEVSFPLWVTFTPGTPEDPLNSIE